MCGPWSFLWKLINKEELIFILPFPYKLFQSNQIIGEENFFIEFQLTNTEGLMKLDNPYFMILKKSPISDSQTLACI